MKKCILTTILIFLLGVPRLIFAGQKIAVIVNGGDQDGQLGTTFEDRAHQTDLLYRKKGYDKIIHLYDSDGATPESFRKSLANESDVELLDIVMIAHGSVRSAKGSFSDNEVLTSELNKRFPISYLREDEVLDEYGTEMTDFSSGNAALRFAFIMSSAQDKNKGWIGLGDLHGAISQLKKSNPQLRTTVSTISCYGGNIIRALQDIPDTQVFASSSGSQVSMISLTPKQHQEIAKDALLGVQAAYDRLFCTKDDCLEKTIERNDFLQNFNEELGNGKTYLEAFKDAKSKYLDSNVGAFDFSRNTASSNNQSFVVIPRAGIELLAVDLCLGPPAKTEVEPFCHKDYQNSISVPMEEFAHQLTQFSLRDFLMKSSSENKKYLLTLQTSFSCNSSNFEEEKKYLQLAFQEFHSFVKKKQQEITDAQIKKQIDLFQNNIAKIKTAQTASELVSLLGHGAQFYATKAKIRDGKDIDFEQEKRTISFIGETLKMLKSNAPDLRNQLLDKEEIVDKCQASITANCALTYLIDATRWPRQYESILKPIFPNRLEFEAEARLLLDKSCSTRTFFKSENLVGARSKQLKCIEQHTKGNPLLRLSTFIAAIKSQENSSFCHKVANSLDREERMNACLRSEQPKEFWQKINELYQQGMR